MERMTLMALVMGAAVASAGEVKSGLQPGEEAAAWNPIHVAGPDRGTTKCPICTYLERPMVVIFTKDSTNAAALAARLERLVANHARHELKGFTLVIDGTA